MIVNCLAYDIYTLFSCHSKLPLSNTFGFLFFHSLTYFHAAVQHHQCLLRLYDTAAIAVLAHKCYKKGIISQVTWRRTFILKSVAAASKRACACVRMSTTITGREASGSCLTVIGVTWINKQRIHWTRSDPTAPCQVLCLDRRCKKVKCDALWCDVILHNYLCLFLLAWFGPPIFVLLWSHLDFFFQDIKNLDIILTRHNKI